MLSKNYINFKQLEKVVGYTRHTCKVYLEGNTFVRGLEKQKLAIQKKKNLSNNWPSTENGNEIIEIS